MRLFSPRKRPVAAPVFRGFRDPIVSETCGNCGGETFYIGTGPHDTPMTRCASCGETVVGHITLDGRCA